MRALAGLSLLAVLAIACGGGDEDPPPPPPPPTPEAVVRAWAADLRRGDVRAAADRFALPSLVANGTPVERLETRVQARSFNASLPCGGRVVKTRRRARLVIATIVLTERPGGDCGAGAGGTATTAFDVRDGKIVRWIRVPERGEPNAPGDPFV